MEYLYQNHFRTGSNMSIVVRYAGGYGYQYLCLGSPQNSYGNIILEFSNNGKMFNVWVRSYAGNFEKGITLTA